LHRRSFQRILLVMRIDRRWLPFAAVVLLLGACSEPTHRAHADDAYQACLDRAYRTGDLGVYDRFSLERSFPGDRGGRRDGLPYPSRLNWPQSAADRCGDLRARGLL
jgi:hypothetical protein